MLLAAGLLVGPCVFVSGRVLWMWCRANYVPSSWVERRRDECWAGFVGVLGMVTLLSRYARTLGVDCPGLRSKDTCTVVKPRRAHWENSGQKCHETYLSPLAFLCGLTFLTRFWANLDSEIFNVVS